MIKIMTTKIKTTRRRMGVVNMYEEINWNDDNMKIRKHDGTPNTATVQLYM